MINIIGNIVKPGSGAGFNLNSYMDRLNLQSDSASNFTLASGAVSQWIDQSPALNHATQATAASRPLYNGGEIIWDGSNDSLALTNEIALTAYSLYIVFKRRVVNSTSMALHGSDGPGNNFFRLDGSDASVARQITLNSVDRPATANFTVVHRLGGEELYNVLSYRRSNGTITVKMNDRTVIRNSISANPTWLTYIKYLGSTNNSLYYDGIIRAACMSSQVLDDATDLQVRNDLYSRYSILSSNQVKLVCIGDSITQGGAVATSFPSYIDPLATAMGLPYVNLGISGEKASDGVLRYQSQGISRPYTDKVVFFFGANDINAGVTAAAYATSMETMAQGYITAGYTIRNLLFCSPCYQRLGVNAATLDAYRTAVFAKADTLGIRKADVLQAFRDDAAPDTLMGDSLHPNSLGNTLLASTINTAFQGA